MKRFHVHLGVRDLDASIRFYSALFASAPTVREPDYAKWLLEDPRLNFAISTGHAPGIDHLGLQADSAAELAELGVRLDAAGGAVRPEPNAVCCYARSDKAWTEDPQGTRWETFHSLGAATTGHDAADDSACGDGTCAPRAEQPAAASGHRCCAPNSNCC